MSNLQKHSNECNESGRPTHGEALPPDALTAKLQLMRDRLKRELASFLIEELGSVIREESRRVLRESSGMQPLMKPKDVAQTLKISESKLEDFIGPDGNLPVLWIGGQRRIHPDTLEAFMRNCAS